MYRSLIATALLLVLAPGAAEAQWRTFNFVDEFGDISDRGASSSPARPIRPMSFPYDDIEATIFVDCHRAWIRFTDTPNPTSSSVAVRVDGNDVGRWRVSHSVGSKDISFTRDHRVIPVLASASTVAVAIPWFGQGSAAFRWSLAGSSAAIQASCD